MLATVHNPGPGRPRPLPPGTWHATGKQVSGTWHATGKQVSGTWHARQTSEWHLACQAYK